jgi:hypothetical protein
VQALAQRHILSAPVITGREEEPDEIVNIKFHADGDVLGFMVRPLRRRLPTWHRVHRPRPCLECWHV